MTIDASIPAGFGRLGLQLPDPIQTYSTLAALKQQSTQFEMLKAQQQKQSTLATLASKAVDLNTGDIDPAVAQQMLSVDPTGQSVNALVHTRNMMYPQKAQAPDQFSADFKIGVDASGNRVYVQPSKSGGYKVVEGVVPPPEEKAPGQYVNGPDGQLYEKTPQGLVPAKTVGGSTVTPKPVLTPSQTKAQEFMPQLQQGMDALSTYEEMLNKKGAKIMDPELDASFTAFQMQLKNLYQLGALAGPDLQLLEKSITPPSSAKGQYYGKSGLLKQLDVTKGLYQQAMRRVQAQAEGGMSSDKAGAQPPPSSASGKNQKLSNDAVKKILQGGL